MMLDVAGITDNALLARLKNRLRTVAIRTNQNLEDMPNALHETISSAYPRANSSPGGSSPVTAWSSRAGINVCLDPLAPLEGLI